MEMSCYTKDREEKGEEQVESSPANSLGMVLADEYDYFGPIIITARWGRRSEQKEED